MICVARVGALRFRRAVGYCSVELGLQAIADPDWSRAARVIGIGFDFLPEPHQDADTDIALVAAPYFRQVVVVTLGQYRRLM